MCKKKTDNLFIKYKDKDLIVNTPVDNWDKYKDSVLSIEAAAKVSDVTNIGVIARYGAGKSSLIKTLFSHLKYFANPIHFRGKRSISKTRTRVVSISAFEHKKDEINDRSFVETEIMKQLFMSVGKQKVPDSRIPRLGGFKTRFVLLPVFFCVALALAVFAWAAGASHFPKGWFSFVDDDNRLNYAAISSIFSGLFAIFFLVDIFICLPFQKMSFSFKDVSATAEKEESYNLLDRYLDEMVYFFEKTRINLVIFEDIDRFENMDVLSDIRSLCFEVNKDGKIRRRGGVAFVYCISDAMKLQAEDKSKFFDIAIPVIPIMNSYNSAETFLASPLRTGGSPFRPSESTIMLLSKFVTEKRVSNAIINDYQFYCAAHERGGNLPSYLHSSLDADTLFALMVYRQLFPADFEKIENGSSNSVLSYGLVGSSTVSDSMILNGFKNDTGSLEKVRIVETIRSFYATIASHRLIEKDFLRLISEFQPGVFKDATDKAFYEKVMADETPIVFDEPIANPEDVFGKLSVQDIGHHSAHNVLFALAVVGHHNPEEQTKVISFCQSFAVDSPDNEKFIASIFKPEISAQRIEDYAFFLASIVPYSPWLVSFVFNQSFSTLNFPLFHAFLLDDAFFNGKMAAKALSSAGNDKISEYFREVKSPTKELEGFNPEALSIIIKQSGSSIKALNEAGKTPQMSKIIEENGFLMTLQNCMIILRDFYGSKLDGHRLFTPIFETGTRSFIEYALLNAPQLVKDWLAEDYDFSGEKGESVQRVISETHFGNPQEWLLPFLKSAASNVRLIPGFVIPSNNYPSVLDSGILTIDFVWFAKAARKGEAPFAYFAKAVLQKPEEAQNVDMKDPDCIWFVSNLENQIGVERQISLGVLLKKLNVEMRTALLGNPPAVYAECYAGKLAYSSSILRGISIPQYKDAFPLFAQSYFEEILHEPDLSFLPEPAASCLFSLCGKIAQKRMVLQKCQNVLFVDKNKNLIEGSVNGAFSANSVNRLDFLYSCSIDPAIVEQIIINSKPYLNYDSLFHFLIRAHKSFAKMAKDSHQIFPAPAHSNLLQICEILVNFGYLIKVTTPSLKNGYLVAPAHMIKT